MYDVVVSEEDDVETRHLLGHLCREVLFALRGADAAVLAAVEESDEYVRLLLLVDIVYPLAGTGHHVLKLQSAPHRLFQPEGDGGRNHAQHGHLCLAYFVNRVGGQVGQSRLFHQDVGTQKRTTHFANPFVVDGVPRLHVVVAHGLHIILHVVDDLGGYVRLFRLYEVGIVAGGLSLQDVAVV